MRICSDEERKATQLEQTIRREETNQKGTGKRRATRKIPRQDKTIQTKQDIPKELKIILPANIVRMFEDIAPTVRNGNKTILEENMGSERIVKANALTNGKRDTRTQRRPRGKMILHPLAVTLQKYQIGKHQIMMTYIDPGFRYSLLSNTD